MNKEKGRNGLGQELELVGVGRPPTGKPKKIMNVKVTEKVHGRLSKMGSVSMDMGDVVEMLLDFWGEHHK